MMVWPSTELTMTNRNPLPNTTITLRIPQFSASPRTFRVSALVAKTADSVDVAITEIDEVEANGRVHLCGCDRAAMVSLLNEAGRSWSEVLESLVTKFTKSQPKAMRRAS
jgi:hypothetical protein